MASFGDHGQFYHVTTSTCHEINELVIRTGPGSELDCTDLTLQGIWKRTPSMIVSAYSELSIQMIETMRSFLTEPMRSFLTEPMRSFLTEPMRSFLTEPMRSFLTEPMRSFLTEPMRSFLTEPMRRSM